MKLFHQSELPQDLKAEIKKVSSSLELEITSEQPENEDFLSYEEKGLSFWHQELGELHLDFLNDNVNYKRKSHRGKSELIAKAVGLPKGISEVFDATLGLAQDAWFLAQLGAHVVGCERSPVLYLLLANALERARAVYSNIRLEIHFADSISYLKERSTPVAVVYMDPMFPEKKKSALPRKEMRIFRHLVGDDLDSLDLLESSLQCASERVVVKRPVKSEPLRKGVIHSFEGNTVRYDLYSPVTEKE